MRSDAGLMRFRILGHVEVRGPDGWKAISAPKWRSLLACLLVRPGQLVPTESLIFELWGDNPPSTANNMVSIYVHRLRKEVIGDPEGRVRYAGLDGRDSLPRYPGHVGDLLLGEPSCLPGEP